MEELKFYLLDAGFSVAFIETCMIILIITALLSFCGIIVFMVLIILNAEPGAYDGWLKFAPLNIVFFGSLLTPRGRIFRYCMFFSAFLFVFCLSSSVFLSMVLKSN